MKSKNSKPKLDEKTLEINHLKNKVEVLEGICKAFSFILPNPIKNPNDCCCTTELYRVQHKLAKDMWVQYINSKQ
jgi:hypothetical protein